MRTGNASRGQPLLVMTIVLVGWVGLRAMTWSSPITYPASLAGFAKGNFVEQVAAQPYEDTSRAFAHAKSLTKKEEIPVVAAKPADEEGRPAQTPMEEASPLLRESNEITPDYWEPAPLLPEPEYAPVPHWQGSALQPAAAMPDKGEGEVLPVPTKFAAGHQILMAAAFSQIEMPPEMQVIVAKAKAQKQANEAAALVEPSKPVETETSAALPEKVADRWSIDGWLLLRPDETPSLAAFQPSYGRSQAGAVLRYRLDPTSDFQPQAYARVTGALDGASENDFATGLSVRLGKTIPLRVAAELRASERSGSWEARPAAFAVTELPLVDLPFDLRGEAYAQAGYVGGDFETGFVDGQVRVDRKLANVGEGELRLGAATWGGTQKGAARLDLGPTASVSFKLGEARARVSADYRLRVAGDAQPNSGPAITLTAGF